MTNIIIIIITIIIISIIISILIIIRDIRGLAGPWSSCPGLRRGTRWISRSGRQCRRTSAVIIIIMIIIIIRRRAVILVICYSYHYHYYYYHYYHDEFQGAAANAVEPRLARPTADFSSCMCSLLWMACSVRCMIVVYIVCFCSPYGRIARGALTQGISPPAAEVGVWPFSYLRCSYFGFQSLDVENIHIQIVLKTSRTLGTTY